MACILPDALVAPGPFQIQKGGKTCQSFSGKDPSKVDRSATYFCRYVARQIVLEGIARRVEVEVSYAIGVADPFSLNVNCFGTGDEEKAIEFLKGFAKSIISWTS